MGTREYKCVGHIFTDDPIVHQNTIRQLKVRCREIEKKRRSEAAVTATNPESN